MTPRGSSDTAAITPPPAVGVRPSALPVLVALAALAFSMRTPTASLPPLLADIQGALGLSGAAAGLLTALPVLCMALCAPPAQRLAERVGEELTALVAVALIAAGLALRLGAADATVLFGATLVAGMGIAVGGVTLPAIVKARFPGRPGAATAAYSVPMMLGAAVAPALAVPLAHGIGSWQASLACWALPALAAAALWAPFARRPAGAGPRVAPSDGGRRRMPRATPDGGLPWRSRGAWLLAAFLSVQSVLAYAYLAWLAPSYEARGWPAATAGALLGLLHVAQLATALALPTLADRSRDRRPVLAGAVSCTVVGAFALVAAPDVAPWAATAVLGLGLGGGFSLALLLLADLSATPAAAGRLAAMTFLVCYSAAAVAPVLAGALHDATGGYTVPFAVLAALACLELALATRLRPALRGTVR